MIASVVLELAATAFAEAFLGSAVDELYAKLKGPAGRRAYQQALAAALKRYAVGEGLLLARPLLQENGLLSRPDIARELAQLVSFEREPDVELIGRRWKGVSSPHLAHHDFVHEAARLVEYLRAELRQTEVFGPVLEKKSLFAIETHTELSAASLADIERQIDRLSQFLETGFGTLVERFASTTHSLRSQIRYFDQIIDDRTDGFVGRKWIFDTVQDFVRANRRGYFFVIGEPGVGKSAVAAQMVKQGGYAHHFNSRAEGINSTAAFLTNMCAQLIAAYRLPYTILPAQAGSDAGFLRKVLGEVSRALEPGAHCLVVVDALDEAVANDSDGENPLYLPITLPENVFFVVTLRSDKVGLPRVECEQGLLRIEADSAHNLADVTDFVRAFTGKLSIRQYIATQGIAPSEFVELLVRKSAGNFMYLHYVLPQIETGAYRDLELNDLPTGLAQYYEDHWRRMRGKDEDAWFEYKLPIIMALTVLHEPASIEELSAYSRVDRNARIRSVLNEWAPFLHEAAAGENRSGARYSLYHASFFDFVSRKQEVVDERVDLRAANRRIADAMWDQFFAAPAERGS
jgi:hypothetical protein